ncbi:hypothetical protein QNH26_20695 [Peribacillus frigoritolerans]|uniref:hypothetical protein n=1 Tax=Peribacillus frigoritolerans TaxID=450367 RepID=UPI0024C0F1C5|nr:hypothetical protein [Peribacillus frigoritolerans]WHX66062.1 hypothetical protein QNH26_20695 [Peribacillus frigoritolerans]
MEYSEIDLKEGKIVLSKGVENFKEIFNEKGSHLYLTTYSYDMPTEFLEWLLKSIEFVNDIKVVFNVFNFDSSESQKIDFLIKRALNTNPYIQFFYNEDNHSKIISNGKKLYIGSANVTSYTKNNFEAGVITINKETIEKVERQVFDYSHLKYEPIFTDPIAPIIVPYLFIINLLKREFDYIEELLGNVDTFHFTQESNLPDDGRDIKKYLKQYLKMFKIAKEDLVTSIMAKSEEYFIVTNLLNEIENSLAAILSLDTIGSETRYFFDFIEDYRNSLEEYKEHFWRINTFENEVVIYKEKLYLSKAEAVLKMLQNLRIKWISLVKNNKFIRYNNAQKKIPIIMWLENPNLAESYWRFFLKQK